MYIINHNQITVKHASPQKAKSEDKNENKILGAIFIINKGREREKETRKKKLVNSFFFSKSAKFVMSFL